jgi:hypothetical protein
MNWSTYDKIMTDMFNINTKISKVDDKIVFNGQDITSGIESAMSNLVNDKYYDFGFELGSTLTNASKAEVSTFII